MARYLPHYRHSLQIAAAALAASPFLLLTRAAIADSAAAKSSTSAPVTAAVSKNAALLQMQDAFTSIAAAVEPTVVNIKSVRDSSIPDGDDDGSQIQPPGDVPQAPKPKGTPDTPSSPSVPNTPHLEYATGSGVIVRSDGYILTNDHVVDGSSTVLVTLYDGREFRGKVYPDYRADLAIVKIDPGDTPLPTAAFAEGGGVRPGQWAIAIGSPFDLENTMTVGVVSAVGRHETIPGTASNPERYYPDLIQTDAAMNPGNSGGPLFNIEGKIIGINVAIESPVDGSAGVGFAIPAGTARRIMDSLIRSGKVIRGYLGVAPDDLTPAVMREFSQKTGAFIRDIALSSPAGRAGLQAGDIITSFDGRPVSGEVTLREAISTTPPGKRIAINYVRDGRPAVANVTITAVPTTADATSAAPAPPTVPINLGITVRAITAHDRQEYGAAPETTGLIVTHVEPGSVFEHAAQSAGLNPSGIIIQRVGHLAVTTEADFTNALKQQSGQMAITVIVLSPASGGGHQTAISVQM